ncbi:MAG: SDR family NAD(P)-dependent oxidoreductase, partial [Terriglobales bacterium]
MRVAVITGAAQGIGRKTAEVLAERGYALALFD